MTTMRDFFFRRFGASQPEKVQKREDFYLAGMPNANGDVFPPRCHMEERKGIFVGLMPERHARKLRKWERNYFSKNDPETYS
jgi:hypothetical protein